MCGRRLENARNAGAPFTLRRVLHGCTCARSDFSSSPPCASSPPRPSRRAETSGWGETRRSTSPRASRLRASAMARARSSSTRPRRGGSLARGSRWGREWARSCTTPGGAGRASPPRTWSGTWRGRPRGWAWRTWWTGSSSGAASPWRSRPRGPWRYGPLPRPSSVAEPGSEAVRRAFRSTSRTSFSRWRRGSTISMEPPRPSPLVTSTVT